VPLLRELQQQFVAAVFDASAASPEFVVSGSLSADQRMAIYRDSIYGNYRTALRDVYPVVNRLIGEACFDSAAMCFIQETPSTSGDIHGFGAGFPQFLRNFPATADLVYLPDVASLEWQMHEIYYAAERTPLNVATLGALSEEVYGNLVFTASPACRLFMSPFPVHRIWQANQPEVVDPEEIDLDCGRVWLLVRRRAGVLELQSLTQACYVLLEWLCRGARFSDALLAASIIQPDFEVVPFLLQQVQLGNLVGFHVSTA
jgi:hypothetical protein